MIKNICCYYLGAGHPNLEIFENFENIEISSIDICANYKPLSTKFSIFFDLAEK